MDRMHAKKKISDEHILAARLTAQNSRGQGKFDAVFIGGSTYEFEEREISFESSPSHSFLMVLPKNIRQLKQEYLKIKFPSGHRPEAVLTDDSGTLNFTFQPISDSAGDLTTRLSGYQTVIKRSNPDFSFFSQEILFMKNGLKAAYLDLCGRAVDGDVYYFYFFVDLTEPPRAEMLAMFSCPFGSRKEWKPLFKQMAVSLKPSSTKSSVS